RLGASREPAKTARAGLGAPAARRCARDEGDPAAAHRRRKSVTSGRVGNLGEWPAPPDVRSWLLLIPSIGHSSVLQWDTSGSSAGGIGESRKRFGGPHASFWPSSAVTGPCPTRRRRSGLRTAQARH